MTLSTLDKAVLKKTTRSYLLFAAFCLVFSLIYARFSHGISSVFMTWAFAVPLVAGALLFALIMGFMMPPTASRRLYHCGVITLTEGFLLKGVFDIYGIGVWQVALYWVSGALLMILGLLLWGMKGGRRKAKA